MHFWIQIWISIWLVSENIHRQGTPECKFGRVLVHEQNLMDTRIKQKERCSTQKWKFCVNLLLTKCLNKLEDHTQHHFSKTNDTVDNLSANQFLIYDGTLRHAEGEIEADAIFFHSYSVSTYVLFPV